MLKLSKKAKEISKLLEENDCENGGELIENDLKMTKSQKTFIESVLTSSDDFWYCLTNGYVDYESLLADKEEIKKIEDAIEVIKDLDELVHRIGLEY